VPNDASDLDLMHREHHGRAAARLTQLVTHRHDRRERRTPAPKLPRNRRSQQPGLPQRRYRFGRKTPLPIDCFGVAQRDLLRDPPRARFE
jgi:hypothetical protein